MGCVSPSNFAGRSMLCPYQTIAPLTN